MSNSTVFDTLLLLALPASGKSEVRRFMRHGDEDKAVNTFHLGETVQLDDFPYVYFFRCVDDELEALGEPRRFYPDVESSFYDGRDWGTLLKLVNGDYEVIKDPGIAQSTITSMDLFSRIDRARTAVGAATVFETMEPAIRASIAEKLQGETERLVNELFSRRPDNLDGHTVVIEFARGGPDGASCPLSDPHGYQYSLSQLSPDILRNSAILYIWVSPEESRRKNLARADPNDPGSILHHCCPEPVMYAEYGTCDMAHLIETSDVPGTVRVESQGQVFHVPIARFDNRVDKTSFVRDEPDTWGEAEQSALHEGLVGGLKDLWTKYTETRS